MSRYGPLGSLIASVALCGPCRDVENSSDTPSAPVDHRNKCVPSSQRGLGGNTQAVAE